MPVAEPSVKEEERTARRLADLLGVPTSTAAAGTPLLPRQVGKALRGESPTPLTAMPADVIHKALPNNPILCVLGGESHGAARLAIPHTDVVSAESPDTPPVVCPDAQHNDARASYPQSENERNSFSIPPRSDDRQACNRRFYATHQAKCRALNERWARQHPLAQAARTAVHAALKSGRLVKQPCVLCDSRRHVVGHHEDYTRPLDVTWLCTTCHRRHHNGTKIAPRDAGPHNPAITERLAAALAWCRARERDYASPPPPSPPPATEVAP